MWSQSINVADRRTDGRHAHSIYAQAVKVKIKFSHTRYRALGPELIPDGVQTVTPQVTLMLHSDCAIVAIVSIVSLRSRSLNAALKSPAG